MTKQEQKLDPTQFQSMTPEELFRRAAAGEFSVELADVDVELMNMTRNTSGKTTLDLELLAARRRKERDE